MTRYLSLLLSVLMLLPSSAFSVTINGPLKNAGLEPLAADPASPPPFPGKAYWNTVDEKGKIYNGATWDYLGSGTGSGIFNLFENGDFESPTLPSGWAEYDDSADVPTDCSGGPAVAFSFARTTTAAQINQGDGALLISKAVTLDTQGQGLAYDLDTLPVHLRNGTVNLNFNVVNTDADYVAGDMRIYVYDIDNANLITPQFITMGGGDTPDLAAGSGAVRLSFLASDADDYRVCFHWAGAGTAAVDLAIDDVFVGDGGITVGSGKEPWTPYTPIFTNLTGLTYTAQFFKRRVDDTLEISGSIDFTAGTGSDSGGVAATIPTGLTIDASKIPSVGSGEDNLGSGNFIDSGTTIKNTYIDLAGSSTFFWMKTGEVFDSLDGVEIASGDVLTVRAAFPIAEWAGGQALGENRFSYACSSDSVGGWDSDADAADTIYGQAGCPISGALTAARTKRVRFQSPVDPSRCVTEVYAVNSWIPVSALYPYQRQNTVGAGMQLIGVTSTATDFDLFIQRYDVLDGATFGATGSNWATASSSAWRIFCASPGVTVPFGLATATQPGLVKTYATSTQTTTSVGTSTGSATSITTKIDNTVFLSLKFSLTKDGTTSSIVLSNAIVPDGYRPTSKQSCSGIVNVNGTSTNVGFWVNTAGTITLFANAALSSVGTTHVYETRDSGATYINCTYDKAG